MLSSAIHLCHRWRCSRHLGARGGKGGSSGRETQKCSELCFLSPDRADSWPRKQVDSRSELGSSEYDHSAWFGAVLTLPGRVTASEAWAHVGKEKLTRKSPDPFSPPKCGFPWSSEPHAVVSVGTRFSTNRRKCEYRNLHKQYFTTIKWECSKARFSHSFFSAPWYLGWNLYYSWFLFSLLGRKMINVPTTKPPIIQMLQGRGMSSLC